MKYDKETLQNYVLKSNTVSDVLRFLNLSVKGHNYRTIKKYLSIFEIDTSHFTPNYQRIKGFVEHNKSIKRTIQDTLIENNVCNSAIIKRLLFNNGLKENKCELCGQGTIWFGKVITLILDHKNGKHDDNRFENLRIVCPNCNATLDTDGTKNMQTKSHHICDCGERKRKTSKTCQKCCSILKQKTERPAYSILLDDVQKIGYVKTGLKYGVSDNSIRKWLKSYER